MSREFAWCKDCNEFSYAIEAKNGAERKQVASNHHNCGNVITFGSPDKYSPPIRNVLTKLKAMMPISDNEMILFKLALALEE